MQIYSSVANAEPQNEDNPNNNHSLTNEQLQQNDVYAKMLREYLQSGFTYKANQILHKTSQRNPKQYPYLLLMQAVKVFQLNQFEIIFFTHVLDQTHPCYQEEPEIFNLQQHEFPSPVEQLIENILQQSSNYPNNHNLSEELMETKRQFKNISQDYQEDNLQQDIPNYTLQELKKIYLYLLVLGYAIKFYLNDPLKIKPYQEHLKNIFPNFFPNVFNKWARKYGNSALNTTPRKINSYYMGLGFLEGEQENNEQKQPDDCQYRNYNEIVEQLIRATKQNQESQGTLLTEELREEDASHHLNQ